MYSNRIDPPDDYWPENNEFDGEVWDEEMGGTCYLCEKDKNYLHLADCGDKGYQEICDDCDTDAQILADVFWLRLENKDDEVPF